MIETDRFEEVTRIKMSREIGGKPLYWVAAYLVDGLLVDTGCAHTASEFVEHLENEVVTVAVNTHYHEDHIGANRLIMKKLGVDIFAPERSIPLIDGVPKLYPYQETVWGYPEPTRVKPLGSSISTERFTFDIVETPGHSPDHVALLEKNKGWCFTGDLFITERPKVVRPEEDIGAIASSMRKLVAMDTNRLVLFTSMGRIEEEGRGALNECAGYFEDIIAEVDSLNSRGMDEESIRDNIFGGESSFASFTDGQFSSLNIVRSALKTNERT